MERSVSAGGNIDNSVVITGDGNNVTLSFGGQFVLPLDRRQMPPLARRRRAPPDSLLPILAPDADALPFVGREEILDVLMAWATDTADVSVQALVAPAGSGKTRLALELCRSLDTAPLPSPGEWVAGFVRPADLASTVERLATQAFDWPNPTLLVIDYAAVVHREIARWLDRLATAPFPGKLRLLLLERDASEGFGWWSDLTVSRENRGTTRRDLFVDPDSPLRVPDLREATSRRALFHAAFREASTRLDKDSPTLQHPQSGEIKGFDEAISADRFGNPLYLAMAGLIAAERGILAGLALRQIEAARFFGARELSRLTRLGASNGVSEAAVRYAIGFNGLAGGLSLETVRADLASELSEVGLEDKSGGLADLLVRELSEPNAQEAGAELRLATIQPDFIGEAVVIEALLIGPPDRLVRARRAVERAYELTGTRAATALMRLIQDYGHLAEDPAGSAEEHFIGRAVLGLLTALTEAIPDEDLARLESLVEAMPKRTTILREAAAVQTRRVADIWLAVAQRQEGANSVAARDRAARWLNNLSIRCYQLGDRDGSLETAQKAVDLQRDLELERPGAFTPLLATSLGNLARALAESGRPEDALQAAQESVDLRRDLNRADPERFGRVLTHALWNLAGCLRECGEPEEALVPYEEGLDRSADLWSVDPHKHQPEIAQALTNQALLLVETGRHDDALKVAREALEIRRGLAETDPDAFLPELARSLDIVALTLKKLENSDEAQPIAREAVRAWVRLVSTNRTAFAPGLARALQELSAIEHSRKDDEAALESARQAAECWQTLAEVDPAQYVAPLALSLSVLGDRLEASGRIREAVDAHRQATAVLAPFLLGNADGLGDLVRMCASSYRRSAVIAKVSPDAGLIEEIEAALAAFERGSKT